MKKSGKCRGIAAVLVCVLLLAFFPAVAGAEGETFTITYMTNAGVKMGEIEYTVGAANAFPQTSELATYFREILLKIQQGGSIYVTPQMFYEDAAFTTPAQFPQGEAGANYTVYCRFTSGLSISQVDNRAQQKSYSTVYGPVQPFLSVDWSASGGRSDQYLNTVATFEKLVDGEWVAVAEEYYKDYLHNTWQNAIWFTKVADSGTYRLKELRYTAKDISGNELYYDIVDGTGCGTMEVSILPVELTITGVQAQERPFDATTQVQLTGGQLNGVLFGDDVSFELGTGTVADAAQGEAKAVQTDIALTGADAENYTLVQPQDVTVNITACVHMGGTATCVQQAVCEICHQPYGEVDAKNHVLVDQALKADETGHYQLCDCGEKLAFAAHTYEWVIDQPATQDKAGQKHQQCTVCGYALAPVDIPATDGTLPQTGDAGMMGWALLMAAAGAMAAVLAAWKKRAAGR